MNAQKQPMSATKKSTFTPAHSGLLQRKCACGSHTVAGGECPECAKKKSGLQRKLAIGASNDPLELEADRVAEQVMAAPTYPAVSGAAPSIQRFTGQAAERTDIASSSVDRVLAGSGRPLEPALRHDMEQRFSRDFSRVRVHTDSMAGDSAREVNAHAYTVGRDIVFGAGRYAPDTARGRKVLAHELTHFVQQDGQRAGKSAALLQRLSFSDVLEVGASAVLGPIGGSFIHQYQQYIDDIVASIKESPQHVGEFLKDEVWESIKKHWLRIMAVTAGLIVAEMAVGALTAAPDPTLLTKVIAVILQIAIIAIIGYFAAVEVKGAYEEGSKWLSIAKRANGNQALITEASRSFVRMVWHIIMAVLAVAGVRARIRGATIPRAGASAVRGTSSGAAAGEGGTVTPISSHPKFQPRSSTPPSSGLPSASAFGPGGTARQLVPAEQPLTEPLTPAPAPAQAKAISTTPGKSPGVQPVPAAGAGVSSATSEDQKRRKDECQNLLNLRPGINDRWHRQRAPIAGHTTVFSAAFRLDQGINPPVGQDTTEASRNWVRNIGLPKDDAGHVIANRFGGRADHNSANGNIFPQDLSFNRGTMRSYDAVAAQLHQSGCDVCVHIGLMYDSPTDLRPSSALYTYLYRSGGATGFNPPISAQVPNP